MKKLIVVFRNFAKALKNPMHERRLLSDNTDNYRIITKTEEPHIWQ